MNNLFDPQPDFDGKTYEPAKDKKRLTTLLAKVFDLMKDKQWRTLAEIHQICGGSEASCSARLRDFRKPKFGGYTLETHRVKRGLFKYRLWA